MCCYSCVLISSLLVSPPPPSVLPTIPQPPSISSPSLPPQDPGIWSPSPFAPSLAPTPPISPLPSDLALFDIDLNFPAPSVACDTTPLSPVSFLLPSLEAHPAAVDPYQALLPSPLTPNQPATTLSRAETPDVTAWKVLIHRFGEPRIRKHQWEWVTSSQSWLPHYRFKAVQKITHIWTEYSDGLDGCLSVRELNVTWGPKWKRNIAGLKSEATRRKKLVDLIEKLATKHRWDTKLALRFVRERYEAKYTPRAFCDYLHKSLSDVLKAAESYP
jgi:Transcriptional activator of glycolytic enzymes